MITAAAKDHQKIFRNSSGSDCKFVRVVFA